jgi:hypothetical protein
MDILVKELLSKLLGALGSLIEGKIEDGLKAGEEAIANFRANYKPDVIDAFTPKGDNQ